MRARDRTYQSNQNRAAYRQGRQFARKNLQEADFSGFSSGYTQLWILLSGLLVPLMGCLLGFLATLITYFWLGADAVDQFVGPEIADRTIGGLSIALLVVLWLTLWKYGLGQAVAALTGLVIVYGTVAGIVVVVIRSGELNVATLLGVSTFTLIVGGMLFAIGGLAAAQLVVGRRWVVVLAGLGVVGSIWVVDQSSGVDRNFIADTIGEAAGGLPTVMGLALLTWGMGVHICHLALNDPVRYPLIRPLAIAWSSYGSPSFYGADLTRANFAGANFKGVDFRRATLDYVNWQGARGLELARWGQAAIADARVAALLTHRADRHTRYRGVNLQFANLCGVNLSGIDLAGADLTGALLRQANLTGVNLADVRAIGADFTGAQLTGACLENWRIDATTQLQNTDCRYVFLKDAEVAGGAYGDRQPASGEFEPGDFANIYQIVADTFDLIFRNGFNLKTFSEALAQIRQANPNAELALQGLRRSGNGDVIVTLEVADSQEKASLYQQLEQAYAQLRTLEGTYQKTLQAQQSQLDEYRDRNQTLDTVIRTFLDQPPALNGHRAVITLPGGSVETGFAVFLQIWNQQDASLRTLAGGLPPNPVLPRLYGRWQQLYRAQQPLYSDGFEAAPLTNFSQAELTQVADQLVQEVNRWLGSDGFRPVDQALRAGLSPSSSIQVVWQTDERLMQQIPLHRWQFFDDYRNSSLSYSFLNTRRLSVVLPGRSPRRVLAVLGEASEIDVEGDRRILESFPQFETTILHQPSQRLLNETLRDPQGWDVFCFCGHSGLGRDRIWLNPQEALDFTTFKHTLTTAVNGGLTLAILNCCSGLDLAKQLADLAVPHTIVMREPVSDALTQAFLTYCLAALAQDDFAGTSLHLPCQQLEALEQTCQYATWLPVWFQN